MERAPVGPQEETVSFGETSRVYLPWGRPSSAREVCWEAVTCKLCLAFYGHFCMGRSCTMGPMDKIQGTKNVDGKKLLAN